MFESFGCSLDEIAFEEAEDCIGYPLKCWQKVDLTYIWIPAHLLTTEKPSSPKFHGNKFHTLVKENHCQEIQGFSVYVDSEEEEIFESDSDNESLFSSNINCDDDKFSTSALAKSLPVYNSAVSNYSQEQIKINNPSDLLLETSALEKQELSSLPSTLSPESNVLQKTSVAQNLCQNLDNIISHCENGLKKNNASSSQNSLTSDANLSNFSTECIKKNHVAEAKVDSGNLNERIPINVINSTCNGYENISNNENGLKKNDSSSSQNSLNEILDLTPDINLTNFSFDCIRKKYVAEAQDKSLIEQQMKEKRNLKRKKKLMKKNAKFISLDNAGGLNNYGQLTAEENLTDKRVHEFYMKVMSEIDFPDYVQLDDATEFPNLQSNGIQFIKSDKSFPNQPSENSVINMQSVADVLSIPKIEEDPNKNSRIEESVGEKKNFKKLMIENIPSTSSQSDVLSLIAPYGDIKDMSIVHEGEFMKVSIVLELNSDCDIDWVIECLDGENPFGASSDTRLKCYDATEI